jgi:uncharacterized protein (DUF1697 family)
MGSFVALLRGVNVGGKTIVSMAALKVAFEEFGATDVRTYIQSGNVVFSHTRSTQELESALEAMIAEHTGRDVDVMLRTATQMQALVDHNPYRHATGTTLHVSFLKAPSDKAALARLDLGRFAPEAVTPVGRELYLYLPNGMGRSKLAVELNKLKAPATARNWNTVTKLLEMLRQ